MVKKGDYIRTYDGFIGKLDYIDPMTDYNVYHFENSFEEVFDIDIKLVKEKPIDLIEVGDYVNGMKITLIDEDNKSKFVFGYSEDGFEGETWFYNDEIKSIVTKEQFESIECKVV